MDVIGFDGYGILEPSTIHSPIIAGIAKRYNEVAALTECSQNKGLERTDNANW